MFVWLFLMSFGTMMIVYMYANPEEDLFIFLRKGTGNLFLNPGMRVYTLFLAFVFIMNMFETNLDLSFTRILGLDFTHFFDIWSANPSIWIQKLRTPFFDGTFTLIYLLGINTILFLTPYYFALRGNERMYALTSTSIIMNYIYAMPFYIFFPVYVAGYTDPRIVHVMNTIFPKVMVEEYHQAGGINNCFPSLHASFSISMFFIMSYLRGHKFLKIFYGILALGISFSTLYLGIHWFLDIMGGLILAGVVTMTSTYLVDNKVLEKVLESNRPVQNRNYDRF